MARWMTKALAVGPAVLFSTITTWLVGAALPPVAGGALFYGGGFTALLLLFGKGEAAAARVLLRSRPLRPAEQQIMAGALTLVCRAGLGPPSILIRVTQRDRSISAGGLGRRAVVVSQGLLDAVEDGTLPSREAAAIVAHAAGVVRGGWARNDAALALWTVPWDLARALANRLLRIPAIAAVLRWRAVIFAIAVVQSVQQQQTVTAVLVGGLGAVSYAIPVWDRRWQQCLLDAGDRAAHAAGLGPAMVAYLRRWPRTTRARDRIRALEAMPVTQPDGSVTPIRAYR